MVFVFGSGAVREDISVQKSGYLLFEIVAMPARADHQRTLWQEIHTDNIANSV